MAIVSVSPSNPNSTHDIALSDGAETFGLILHGGPTAIHERPDVPSTLLVSSGGRKYGTFDANFTNVEQRDWSGGLGAYDFQDDGSRFKSGDAWSLTESRLLSGLQYKFATGYRSQDLNQPGSQRFERIDGTPRLAGSFSASASYTAKYIDVWMRKVGAPTDTIRVGLQADSAGSPSGTWLSYYDISAANIDIAAKLYHLAVNQALTSSTTYWVVVGSDKTDTPDNYVEIALNWSDQTGKKYASSAWGTYGKIFFRVTDADTNRNFKFFDMQGALYTYTQNADKSASKLYIIGDRGTATAGASTTITDSGKSWGTTKFVGAKVKIVSGAGKDQFRTIASHTATVLTVSQAWDVTPDTTSMYVIYDTDVLTEISTTGLGYVNNVAVAGNIAYFAQGQSVNIRRMRVNGSSHDFADDGTNKADLMYLFYVGSTPKLWAINNTTVTFTTAAVVSWGTNLTLANSVSIGTIEYPVVSVIDYDKTIFFTKRDSIWYYDGANCQRLNVGLGSHIDMNNGKAVATQGLFMYFSFAHSMERFISGQMDDIGPWKEFGLQSDRVGNIVYIEPVVSWLLCANDSPYYSSVLAYNGLTWHYIFVSPVSGWKMGDIKWQSSYGGNPRLWVSINGELMYIKMPAQSLNPINDSNVTYRAETVVETPKYDFGYSELYKYVKSFSVILDNPTTDDVQVFVDYKIDNSDTWIIGTEAINPSVNTASIGVGQVRNISFRLRLRTTNASTPVKVVATVVKALVKVPFSRIWDVRVKSSDFQRSFGGNVDHRPSDVYNWLMDASRATKGVIMSSKFKEMDGVRVVIEPPSVVRKTLVNLKWAGDFVLTLREI